MTASCHCGAQWTGTRLDAHDAEPCSIPLCDLPRRTHSADWCEKHYMRNARHGHPLRTARSGRGYPTSHGYRAMHRPNHPLADSNGVVYEHRLVLYADIGPDAQLCYWCDEAILVWGQNLEVDHLDGNRSNNTPANLVPCCHACNTWRTKLRNTNGAAR